MNYYNEIKSLLINNEVNRKVKTYSINKSDLDTYYQIGKMLHDAGKCYGEGIIKEYSKKLCLEVNKKYSVRYLFDIKKLYIFSKVHPLDAQLSFSHYRLLFSIKNENAIDYYINKVIANNMSKRGLQKVIMLKEYERLSEDTKEKLRRKEKLELKEMIPNPIIIKNNNGNVDVSEKVLQRLILEDISSFLKELGDGFTFIDNEYKIRIGNAYNYIDLLLFNYLYNCFVVIELKVNELKKQDIGQIEIYMNYIDKNVKRISHDKTIGIIICKENNKYIIEYSSDKRIITRKYILL